MDPSELERQKATEILERSRVVLEWTRNSDAGDQSGSSKEGSDDSHSSVEDMTEEILPNVVPNIVPPTSPNGGDDLAMVQQPPTVGVMNTLDSTQNFSEPEQAAADRAMDSSSDDDSLTLEAEHVGGVLNTFDATLTFSESNTVDEPEQAAADRAMATRPSVLDLVAELIPETDDVEAENERLREELQLEREERENNVLVVASSAEPRVEENNFTKRKTTIYRSMAVFAVIGVAVAVAVGVTSANSNTTPSKPPIVSPTDEPSSSPSPTISRFDLFLEALLGQDPDLEVSVMKETGTPQFQALSWLDLDDPLNLDPETAPGRDILERFVVATFYFATNGSNWNNPFNFLNEKSVCDWNNGEPLHSVSFGGISCNESDHVANLSMGKLVRLFYVMDNTWHGNQCIF
jgi:hypothetical protein